MTYHKEVLSRLNTLSTNFEWGIGCYSTVLWIQLNLIQLNSSDGVGLKLYDRADCQNFTTERFREIAQELDAQSPCPSTVTTDSVNSEIAELPPNLQSVVNSELGILCQRTEYY